MNELMTVTNETQTTSSYDFLQQVNKFRKEAGESTIRNNDFIKKVEKECDDLGGYEKFVTDTGGTPMKFYNLTEDQMMLVGMRESKVVRKRVLVWIRELEAKVAEAATQQIPTNFLEAMQLATATLEDNAKKTKLISVQNVQIEDLGHQVELGVKEVNRLQGVCETVITQFSEGLTVPCLCKSFNGVNTQQVNAKLLEIGMLFETKYGKEPTSYTRDNYFKVSYVTFTKENGDDSKKAKVTLTLRGAKWLYKAYLAGKLPMKKTWDGRKVHVEFEVK